jgi:hypothetical protein
MYLGIPQIIYLILWLLGAGIAMAKHGEPKTGKYDFWTTLLSSILALGLLYWGGFFAGR